MTTYRFILPSPSPMPIVSSHLIIYITYNSDVSSLYYRLLTIGKLIASKKFFTARSIYYFQYVLPL